MVLKRSCVVWIGILFCLASAAGAGDMEAAGVTFPGEKTVDGKTLTLNGVAVRKALVFINVYAGGFYLEHPTGDPREAIESEQVKHFHLHYLTSKATAEKLQEGFIEKMVEANPPELVEEYRREIDLYASWLDQDMEPGATSLTTYVPGKGLTLVFKGEEKGTIPGSEFAQMYFRYNLGDKADATLRDGYLGK
ncbi:MAG: chalcone isomerase family protein [Desulfobacterales bacterium]